MDTCLLICKGHTCSDFKLNNHTPCPSRNKVCQQILCFKRFYQTTTVSKFPAGQHGADHLGLRGQVKKILFSHKHFISIHRTFKEDQLGETSKFPPSNHKLSTKCYNVTMLQNHLRGSVTQSVIFGDVSQN